MYSGEGDMVGYMCLRVMGGGLGDMSCGIRPRGAGMVKYQMYGEVPCVIRCTYRALNMF